MCPDAIDKGTAFSFVAVTRRRFSSSSSFRWRTHPAGRFLVLSDTVMLGGWSWRRAWSRISDDRSAQLYLGMTAQSRHTAVLQPIGASLSCVFLSKSLASCRSCRERSPCRRSYMHRRRCTPSRRGSGRVRRAGASPPSQSDRSHIRSLSARRHRNGRSRRRDRACSSVIPSFCGLISIC